MNSFHWQSADGKFCDSGDTVLNYVLNVEKRLRFT